MLKAVAIGRATENRCSSGKFGNNCAANCSCNVLGSTGNCSFYGRCSCYDGYWGNKCERRCNRYCRSNKCDPEWGICKCNDFKYGTNCDKVCDCDQTLSSGCDIIGRCLCIPTHNNEVLPINGSLCSEDQFCDSARRCKCKDWKHGTNCEHEATCNRRNSESWGYNGECTCKVGYYGVNCESECPTDCQNSFSSNSCKFNGTCDCIHNYYGNKCQHRCYCDQNHDCNWLGLCQISATYHA
ncbi:multiple epidermal growth factor-like domains protein 10 [Gordionus sp. m RMFG-2023]|uniref:multiple epidermal growth factor-like domains protein 10 n=1 Tax=Gordionus sp. m RMFG-2023 TaxID=3053472 RepID=UPI0031FC8460